MRNGLKVSAKQARQKLKDDFGFYARNCLKIRTKDAGVQPFELNRAQTHIHNKLEEQREKTGKVRAIILKGRQQGASTYIGGRFMWRVSHAKGVRAFILTHEDDATQNLFDMSKRYYDGLPEYVKPERASSNAREMMFPELDSGYKVGTAGNKSVGRSQTNQLFHGSEVAFWPNAAEHAKGILQTIPDAEGTEIVFESTANGVGNYYHVQWKQAEAGLGEFIAIFVPWYWQTEYTKDVPEHVKLSNDELEIKETYNLTDGQMYWRRLKIVELSSGGVDGSRSFRQEYPMNAAEAFQTSGDNGLITSSAIMRARKADRKGSGPLVVGVDPSRGGDRFSTIKRQGPKAYGLKSYKGEAVDKLGKAVSICVELLDTVCPLAGKKPDMMFIDAGGGADLVDRLHELGYEDRVKAIAFGSTPIKTKRYKNKRGEMWGECGAWLNDENMPVQIPDCDSLHADLAASPYDRDSNDRIILWKKERIKEKLGFSPDEGDALVLTFAEPVNTGKKVKINFKGWSQ